MRNCIGTVHVGNKATSGNEPTFLAIHGQLLFRKKLLDHLTAEASIIDMIPIETQAGMCPTNSYLTTDPNFAKMGFCA